MPTFLVIGAAKSGTTSLYHYLKAHPDVFMPRGKEPTYFIDPAHRHVSWAEYQQIFAGASGYPARGEASVGYLYDPVAPVNIAETLGRDTAIVVMLRNPVEVAHSLWAHMTRIDRETLSFEAALDAEAEREASSQFWETAGTWPPNLFYARRASYAEQLERYLEIFGRERVLVLIFETFFADPHSELARAFRFIGVEPERCAPIEFANHNPAGVFRSSWLRRLVNEPSPTKELAKRAIAPRIRLHMKEAFNQLNLKPLPREDVDASTRRRLEAQLAPDVARVSELVNLPLAELWFGSGVARNDCAERS